jgi:hypothetical protein
MILLSPSRQIPGYLLGHDHFTDSIPFYVTLDRFIMVRICPKYVSSPPLRHEGLSAGDKISRA